MLIAKNSFEGGLNGDDSVRLIPANAMLNAMNCRMAVTEYGRNLRLENLPGTTAISQSVFPPYGTNLTLGAVPDDDRNRIIFFNYNSFGYHGIYCLDYSSPSIPVVYAVLYDTQVSTGLDFSKSYRIDRNARVVGDLLYWTDNLNQPRRLNIEAGIKMNHPSYSTTVAPYSYPMNESVISLIRRPYGLAVIPTKIVAGVATNFIKSFAGQFASRLIYRDNEQSVISVPSEMINYNLETDTFDDVQVIFPLAETFEQDVQIVQLVVRYDNDPNYFVVKEWNKDNATDLAEINAHNNGITNLTYNFYNDKIGLPISNEDSVKPFDNIPITAKTLETANNRLFLANYVKGYDTPTTTSLAATLVSGSGATGYTRIWKSYSTYQLAIQFRDKYKRKSFTVTNSSLVITIPDRTIAFATYTTGINWTVSNALATLEIPDWAYYYDILITKNLRTRNFITANGFPMQYAKKQPDGTFTYQNTYDSNVFGIGLATSLMNNESGIGYVHEEGLGDTARLYLNSTATVYSLPVIAQDAEYVIVQAQDLGNTISSIGVRFELYTPYKQQEKEFFYTTGATYKITNPTTGSRSYSTTSGILSGDVYRWFDQLLEFMSPNNKIKWNSWTNIYGEVNIQDLLGQVDKENFIQWSNTIINGSKTNGLSTFDALDEKSLPESMGEINKLQVANKVTEEGNVMLAIGAKETASLYLGEVQLVGASANAFIASSPGVIGTINILRGSYGTINPESVIEYLGLVCWLDVLNGCFVQYSNAGLEPVSRYKMSRFFQRYCKNYLDASTGNLDNINGFHHIPTGIDPFHKEVLCTLPGLIYENYATSLPSYSSVPSYATSIVNRFDVYDSLAKTMSFQFEENKFGSNYEYMPEMYAYLQNTMFAFKNGLPYTHNTNTTNWNTFYGVEYPVRLCFASNTNPSALKVLNNIALESNTIPDFTVAYADYPNIQLTDLASTDDNWVNQEGTFYADFLKDRLSPNASGTADQKLFTGDDLTDIALKIMCEWGVYESLFFINFANIGFSVARGQKQIINPVNQ